MSEDWRHRANCRGTDPEAFFPVGSGSTIKERSEPAKRVCQRCPVQAECLKLAIEEGLGHGVFGGLDEEERRAIRRKEIQAAMSA